MQLFFSIFFPGFPNFLQVFKSTHFYVYFYFRVNFNVNTVLNSIKSYSLVSSQKKPGIWSEEILNSFSLVIRVQLGGGRQSIPTWPHSWVPPLLVVGRAACCFNTGDFLFWVWKFSKVKVCWKLRLKKSKFVQLDD